MFEEFIIWSPIWLTALVGSIIGLVYFIPTVAREYAGLFEQSIAMLLITMPYWLPVLGIIIFWNTWVVFVRGRYLAGIKWSLLELKLPLEITKTPLAMETFLMSLHQGGSEATFIDRWWKGQTRGIFSLEIISVEGQIKFLIYTQTKFRGMIEAALYAQYPDIEIHEAVDYTHSVHFDPKESDMYVIDYKFTAPDPYPINTYVEYGIDDTNVDEENKIDPINHMLEFMGSIGTNQQCWFQLIMRLHKDDQHKPGTLFGKWDKFKDDAKKEIEKIRASAVQKTGDDKIKFPNPTKGEQERIAAIERKLSKLPFDVGLRGIYFAKKEFFNGGNIGSLRTMLRAYSTGHLNGFKPMNWLNDFDYPWQDYKDMRKNALKREGLEAYKRRSYFYPPFVGKLNLVMNTEEIASIFHLPGQVAKTPTLPRLPSKRSEAPGNLPI
ncbi:MAG: hypothetical protein JWO73_735 [Candidatus Taylorbacteria bacterium]|nr:hypothetical protein [Candidatus Taylorbacteria bacterium]